MMVESQVRTIAEMRRLTEEYASFSRSRGGLGNVLGGVAGLAVFGAIWLFGGNVLTAILSIVLTAVWLVGKELIRGRLYRRFGQAREVWTGAPRRGHQIIVSIFTLLLLGFAVWIVADGWLAKPAVAFPYLIFCLLAPLIAWRYLYTTHDMVIGFGLLFLCAVTASGHTPFLLAQVAVPVYAVAMIVLGLAEHRQFQALAVRLHADGEVEA